VRPAPIFQPSPIPNTPTSAPPPAPAGEAAIAAFCAELGLDASQLDANAARQMGIIVRIVVQGMLGVLQARTEVKNNFRMPLTSMRPVENNPLKFSMNAEHAVHNLFVNRNPGYLPAAEAFQEAFEDVEIHQMAMLVGIRAAFNAMLARLTPDRLEETYERRLKRTSLLGVTMKSKYWELYREYFEDLARDPEATFQNLFGEEFAKAYHAQMQSLATAGRNRSR
jgi:type VI secretion system FHA domain protein